MSTTLLETTTTTSRPPPSSFNRLPPISTSYSNPAPTPPPSSPLPALPSFPSPFAEQDSFGSFPRPSLDNSGWRNSVASSIREETINNAFLLGVDPWHSTSRTEGESGSRPGSAKDTGLGAQLSESRRSSHDRDPKKRTTPVTASSRRNPTPNSSSSATLIATSSSRNSVASDIVSLAETSRSLQNLSRRLSSSCNDTITTYFVPTSSERLSSASLDSTPQDPFEFDRLDDPQNFSSNVSYRSRTSLSTSSSSHSASSLPPHIRVSTARERNHAHYLLTSREPSRSPQLSPTSIFTFGHQQHEPPMATLSELLQRQKDLAGKRANLDALRAEILGISSPRSPNNEAVPRPSTSDSTISLSSTSTARPGAPIGIFVRPSTSSSTRSPTKSAYGDGPSPSTSEFSVNQSIKEEDVEGCATSPPPVPPKDTPSTPVPGAATLQELMDSPSSSPEISKIIQSVHVRKSLSRSQSRIDISSASRSPVSSEPPCSRPTSDSVPNSGRATRNWSYPTDRTDAQFVAETYEAEEVTLTDIEDELYGKDGARPSSYYYSGGNGPTSVDDVMNWNSTGVMGPFELGLTSGNVKAVHVQEDDDGTSSESSLDLHTPLPDIMVKAGILSPRSAVLAARNTTENGIIESAKSKEEIAATLRKGAGNKVLSKTRLVRHRDGKMLGLGLGLTTGLGWSDSEDEDAPSPLRRHISQVILHKKGSVASISTFASDYNGDSRRVSTFSAATGRMSMAPSLVSRNGSVLSSQSLQKSHSLASISSALDKPVARRQLSSPNPTGTPGSFPPPSSFMGGRRSRVSSKASSTLSSRPSSSSLRQPHQMISSATQPPPATGPLSAYRARSPSSSNTSISTSSSMVSPVTPASATASPNITKVEPHAAAFPSHLVSGGGSGLGILEEENARITMEYYVASGPNSVKRIGPPARPDIRRVASSNAPSPTPTLKTVRPRPSTSTVASTSAPSTTAPGTVSIPANIQSTRTRQRTISSSSSAPPVRQRTISNGSTTSNAGAIKSKPSVGSLRSVGAPSSQDSHSMAYSSRREKKSSTGSMASLSVKAPPPLSMTVGSLAFPSPPPLSPAVVNMKLAQVQAQQMTSSRKLGGSQLVNSTLARRDH